MSEATRWIALDGAVNVRDLGGLPTADGRTTRFGRVLRSDNLQGLTEADVRRLVGELELRDVVDLRSHAEVALEGPGPLTRVPEVSIHHLTLFPEVGRHTDVDADTPEAAELAELAGDAAPSRSGGAQPHIEADKVLPWQGKDEEHPDVRALGFYYAYLLDRPDSVLAALRVLAHGDGAAIVHCAAGKDRTGVVCALALSVAGVTRDAIVADYAATGDRMAAILARLRASDTYRDDLDSRPADSHLPRPEYMDHFLRMLEDRDDGPLGWLSRHGWTGEDAAALRSRLLS
ncbi:phosphotyrosine protein phosphatase [Sphaerisporangium melleum]|uniref:Phosphotyrosine protein phosphatase n=1 Tax=Sphaerisporangium melleum TaxID=321316 RepID=A0A917R4V4_9ACTN|nr:tyrosine-protein phosphatase [Sphaerisporangium melleum]GGK90410.1 phosphotyrosine protein phosphatase [Sphaerisporangium melleum]GII72869.1 phosphotyrosine protein phosphatase [Sphaerisporangium melleum]